MFPKHAGYPSLEMKSRKPNQVYAKLTAHAAHDLLFVVGNVVGNVIITRNLYRTHLVKNQQSAIFIANKIALLIYRQLLIQKADFRSTFEVAFGRRNDARGSADQVSATTEGISEKNSNTKKESTCIQ